MAKRPTTDPNVITINVAPNAEAKARTAAVSQEAAAIKSIQTEDACREATVALGKVQTLKRWIKKAFDVSKRPILDAQRKLNEEQNGYIETLDAHDRNITREINDFRRRESEARAAKAEKERLEREEAARLEQQRRADELRAAAAAAPTKKVAKLLNQQAEIITAAEPIVDHAAPEETPSFLAGGQHDRRNYFAAVHNKEKLLLQVAAQEMIARHGAPPEIVGWLQQFRPNVQASTDLLTPHMPALNTLAKALKSDLALEGVTAEYDDKIITRS